MDRRTEAFFKDFRRFLDFRIDGLDCTTEEGQAKYDILQEVTLELQQHKHINENWDK